MSIVLCELFSGAMDVEPLTLSVVDYDSDIMHLEQGDQTLDLTRKQLQGLSLAIEAFLDQ